MNAMACWLMLLSVTIHMETHPEYQMKALRCNMLRLDLGGRRVLSPSQASTTRGVKTTIGSIATCSFIGFKKHEV